MIYIIEHLEEELYEWCIIEYENISKVVGKDNLWFTNIKNKDIKKLKEIGKVFEQSIKDLQINLKESIVLDPEAKEILKAKDKKYKYFIFGGILGDHPPRKRTEIELTRFLPKVKTRHIGKDQFSTDNAVIVTKMILEGKQFKDIKFRDGIEIKINEIESTYLPYKYPIIKGKPQISKELIKYLKKKQATF